MSVSVFFLGATGYIGGSLLKAILASPFGNQFKITALYRSPKDEERLAALGVTPLKGDMVADPDTVESAARSSDLVIDCAHSDTSVQAILTGLAKQHEETGKRPIYIHTSGTGVLSDDSLGMFEGGEYYDVGAEVPLLFISSADLVQLKDSKVEDMQRIPEDAWHRDVDLAIYAEDEKKIIHAYIVMPALVYGVSKSPFKTYSLQIPKLTDLAIARGQAGQVGKGVSRRGSVHVDDLTDLYLCLLERLYGRSASTGTLPSGWEGTFIGSAQEVTWGALSKEIGNYLQEKGFTSTEEVTSFTVEEMKAIGPLAGKMLGSNSRPTPVRAKRDLGWKPKCPPAEKCAAGDAEDYLRNIGKL